MEFSSFIMTISIRIFFTAALFGLLALWEAQKVANVFRYWLWRPDDTGVHVVAFYYYYYYYYYYYFYVKLIPARATTVLHCPLSCMQACISSNCIVLCRSLECRWRCQSGVPFLCYPYLVPTAQGWKQFLLGAWHNDLPASAFLFVSWLKYSNSFIYLLKFKTGSGCQGNCDPVPGS